MDINRLATPPLIYILKQIYNEPPSAPKKKKKYVLFKKCDCKYRHDVDMQCKSN